jgi:hypothetical protein
MNERKHGKRKSGQKGKAIPDVSTMQAAQRVLVDLLLSTSSIVIRAKDACNECGASTCADTVCGGGLSLSDGRNTGWMRVAAPAW